MADSTRHPRFYDLGFREQHLASLLASSRRVEEVLAVHPRVDHRAAIAVAAEELLIGLDGAKLLVVCERAELHEWAKAWNRAGGFLSRVVSGTFTRGSTASRSGVTFIDVACLSRSDYGAQYAAVGYDLVISEWENVLSEAKGKKYLASAGLRSGSNRSWVVAPKLTEKAAFTLGAAGLFLNELPVEDEESRPRRSRPSSLAGL